MQTPRCLASASSNVKPSCGAVLAAARVRARGRPPRAMGVRRRARGLGLVGLVRARARGRAPRARSSIPVRRRRRRRGGRRRAPRARARARRCTRRPLVSACSCMSDAVGGRPAVGEQRLHGPDLAVERGDDVLDLEGDRLERGAGELGRAGAEGEAAERARPPRRPTTARRGRRTRARGARRRCWARRAAASGVGRGAEQLGQPGQRRAAGADVALEGVAGGVGRARRSVSAERLGPAVGGSAEAHDRGAGAVGGLDLPGPPAGVGEQRGVRVAHHGVTGMPSRSGGRSRTAGNGPQDGDDLGAAPPPGRRTARAARGSQLARWTSSSCVREALPTSIRCSPPRRLSSQESTVPRHSSPRRLRARSGSWASSSQRAFGAENIGSSGSPLTRARRARRALVAEPVAVGGRALVLPAQQRADAARRRALPQHERLALRAQADGGDAVGVLARQALRDGGLDAVPDLRPPTARPSRAAGARARAGAAARDDRAAAVDEQRLRRARALVDGEQHRAHAARAATEGRAASAMPSAVRPKCSSRKAASAGGRELAAARRGSASAPAGARRRARPPRRRGRR